MREGHSLGDAMEQHGLTTPVAARMLRVGERSGNMGEMMERIAAFYDEELSRWVGLVTRLIEPALMSLIGLVIGVIVVLMYFPIFELAGSINERRGRQVGRSVRARRSAAEPRPSRERRPAAARRSSTSRSIRDWGRWS